MIWIGLDLLIAGVLILKFKMYFLSTFISIRSTKLNSTDIFWGKLSGYISLIAGILILIFGGVMLMK